MQIWEDDVEQGAAKLKLALVMYVIQGKATVDEASRSFRCRTVFINNSAQPGRNRDDLAFFLTAGRAPAELC